MKVDVYGRGYLGRLISNTVYSVCPVSLFGGEDIAQEGNFRTESIHRVAILASGPSSVMASESELQAWIKGIRGWESSVSGCYRHIIYISSAGAVYGEYHGVPHVEDDYLSPISEYGRYHSNVEEFLLKSVGHKLTIIRLSNLYGPNQLHKEGQGFVTAVIRSVKASSPLKIYGDGLIERDYLHEYDFIDLIKKVVEKPKFDIFNAGSSVGTSQNTIINLVEDVFKKRIIRVNESGRAEDVKKNVLSIKKVEDYYKWSPRVSLLDGIKTYIDK